MLQLTNIQEEELFKICLEFWHWFAHDVMNKTKGQHFFVGSEIPIPNVPGMDFAFAQKKNLQNSNSYLHL